MNKLADIRKQFFKDRKVICTGNPNKQETIASAVKHVFPNATFIHLTNGWDLTDTDIDDKLTEIFSKHNTFINASYIGTNIQTKLLNICQSSVKFCDVFNIGSTHEYDEGGSEEYRQDKLELRNKSLAYNTFRFKTHHIIVGKISPQDITTKQIADVIYWIMQQEFEIPMIVIDQPKQPW